MQTKTTRCSGRSRGWNCDAEIFYAVNEKTGKRVPLDAQPSPDGRFIVTGDGTCRSLTDAEIVALPAGTPRYTNHWLTCADASRFANRRLRLSSSGG
jgi:hypothetical protein